MTDGGSRRSRWLGLIALGLDTLWTRASRTAPRQTAFMLAGIAGPVALMFLVTSVSLGLASGATVASPDVDYWIVPESDASSAVVSVGGPQFGRVHQVNDRLSAREDVTVASPVALELLKAETEGESEFVLVVGVIPSEDSFEVIGVSTDSLTAGDPHYANGTYSGPRTDEAVISTGASDLFGVGVGDRLTLETGTASNQSVRILAVESGGLSSDLPIVVVHLSELQTLVGTTAGDPADQILVKASNPAIEPVLEQLYPDSVVISRGELNQQQFADSELALAMALSALLIAVIIGVLFSATTIGLAVADRAPERAVLAAVGLSARSRATLVAVETVVLSVIGGILGVALGFAGLPVVDYVAREFAAGVAVTEFQPVLLFYGVGVGVLIGVLVVPYLWFIGRRTVSMEVLYD